MFFALTACGNKDKCAETDPDKTKVTENVSNGDTGSSKDNNIDGFYGVIVLGEKGNLYISYPTDLLKKDGYGGLAPVSDSGIRFKSDVYVYPEGSSSIGGSNHNMSNYFISEKDFHDDLTYKVGDFIPVISTSGMK